jgi:purine-binding chemotaxis protein CheW
MSPLLQDNPATHRASPPGGETTQLVCFRLGCEEYGVAIMKVQEIILLGPITRVPQTPDYLRGLINLRSTILPVIDLRLRFGLSPSEPTEETRIMVVNVLGKTVGLIVDAVAEVLRIASHAVQPPPSTVAGLGHEYLSGLAQIGSRVLILLDIDRILDPEDPVMTESFESQESKKPIAAC